MRPPRRPGSQSPSSASPASGPPAPTSSARTRSATRPSPSRSVSSGTPAVAARRSSASSSGGRGRPRSAVTRRRRSAPCGPSSEKPAASVCRLVTAAASSARSVSPRATAAAGLASGMALHALCSASHPGSSSHGDSAVSISPTRRRSPSPVRGPACHPASACSARPSASSAGSRGSPAAALRAWATRWLAHSSANVSRRSTRPPRAPSRRTGTPDSSTPSICSSTASWDWAAWRTWRRRSSPAPRRPPPWPSRQTRARISRVFPVPGGPWMSARSGVRSAVTSASTWSGLGRPPTISRTSGVTTFPGLRRRFAGGGRSPWMRARRCGIAAAQPCTVRSARARRSSIT